MMYVYGVICIGSLLFTTFGYLAGVYLRWRDRQESKATEVPQAFYDAFGEGDAS